MLAGLPSAGALAFQQQRASALQPPEIGSKHFKRIVLMFKYYIQNKKSVL
jgi:hypothetical protein